MFTSLLPGFAQTLHTADRGAVGIANSETYGEFLPAKQQLLEVGDARIEPASSAV